MIEIQTLEGTVQVGISFSSSTSSRWIHELAPWTHAVTLTFRRRDIKGQAVSEQIIIQALRHFLRVLDKCCYSGSEVRRGAYVPSAVVIGWGAYNNHPHAHLALSCPQETPHETFENLIESAAEATDWIDVERRVEPYRNEGWAEYMLNHGIENLITNLTRAHQPEIVG